MGKIIAAILIVIFLVFSSSRLIDLPNDENYDLFANKGGKPPTTENEDPPPPEN
ncbi:hypothetical protein QA612_04405 [Evansella sp. AB-P1]|uniref:hypothetical protein n=1 Tax=Evansella sp. AB-P1 TaxID=3037653 RepID=UPI00241D9AD3|nr:hypothetical protein [Evansella sp. AB-P1]MDG5786723.1 hypothetical protein [Evansella sp. AB-P1]